VVASQCHGVYRWSVESAAADRRSPSTRTCVRTCVRTTYGRTHGRTMSRQAQHRGSVLGDATAHASAPADPSSSSRRGGGGHSGGVGPESAVVDPDSHTHIDGLLLFEESDAHGIGHSTTAPALLADDGYEDDDDDPLDDDSDDDDERVGMDVPGDHHSYTPAHRDFWHMASADSYVDGFGSDGYLSDDGGMVDAAPPADVEWGSQPAATAGAAADFATGGAAAGAASAASAASAAAAAAAATRAGPAAAAAAQQSYLRSRRSRRRQRPATALRRIFPSVCVCGGRACDCVPTRRWVKSFLVIVLLGVCSTGLAIGFRKVLVTVQALSLAEMALRNLTVVVPETAGAAHTASATSHATTYLILLPYFVLPLLVALTVTALVSPSASGSGIPRMKAVFGGVFLPDFLTFPTLCAKVVGLLGAVASGLSVGSEGPFVHIACCIGAVLLRVPIFDFLNRNIVRRHGVLAMACAAGVVAAFGTPFGGLLFAIEVVATYFKISDLPGMFWASLVGVSE
jgi:hypothetical protein